MAYGTDYRKRVLEYLSEGHTQAEASEVFKIGTATIKGWKRLLKETGGLENRPLEREARIYKSDGLREYIEQNPQAFLYEIAAHFGGSIPGAANALARENITLKKRQ